MIRCGDKRVTFFTSSGSTVGERVGEKLVPRAVSMHCSEYPVTTEHDYGGLVRYQSQSVYLSVYLSVCLSDWHSPDEGMQLVCSDIALE